MALIRIRDREWSVQEGTAEVLDRLAGRWRGPGGQPLTDPLVVLDLADGGGWLLISRQTLAVIVVVDDEAPAPAVVGEQVEAPGLGEPPAGRAMVHIPPVLTRGGGAPG